MGGSEGCDAYGADRSESPFGHNTVVGSTFRCSARDFARLGYLWLNRGRWGDEQLVPEKWMELATRRFRRDDGKTPSPYGYTFWIQDQLENVPPRPLHVTGPQPEPLLCHTQPESGRRPAGKRQPASDRRPASLRHDFDPEDRGGPARRLSTSPLQLADSRVKFAVAQSGSERVPAAEPDQPGIYVIQSGPIDGMTHRPCVSQTRLNLGLQARFVFSRILHLGLVMGLNMHQLFTGEGFHETNRLEHVHIYLAVLVFRVERPGHRF